MSEKFWRAYILVDVILDATIAVLSFGLIVAFVRKWRKDKQDEER
jgi:hypothetical protein